MTHSHDELWSIIRDLDSLLYQFSYELTADQREKYNAARKKLGWCSVSEPDYSGSPGNMS
jgi:hypothetical protein